MDRRERWSSILQSLAVAERLSVEDVADAQGVSLATIRRDFEELASQQLLVRTRGGAMVNDTAYNLPLRYRGLSSGSAKVRIAAAVADLVSPGMVVGLNGGTTTTEVARALAARADRVPGGRSPSLTVVTNALNIASGLVLHARIKVVVSGGVAHHQSYELVGPLTEQTLGQLAFDTTILGVDALSAVGGARTHDEEGARTNRLLADRARSVIVATDSSKLSQHAFALICETAAISIVVTDVDATDEQVAALEAAGPKVHRV